MTERQRLETTFRKHGFEDFRWIDPAEIAVAQWVRMKCLYGCGEYGRAGTCPPNTPPVEECKRFFLDYSTAAIFHFEKSVARPGDRHAWSRRLNLKLSALEKDVFLSGFVKAFMLFMDSCTLCRPCAGSRDACKKPFIARPSPEAMAIDVYTTVLRAGYPIEVLRDCRQSMNRYALLMVK